MIVEPRQRRVYVINAIASAFVVFVFCLFPPLGYAIHEYLDIRSTLDERLTTTDPAMSRWAASAPDLWMYQQVRLQELLSEQPRYTVDVQMRIRDIGGTVLAVVGAAPSAPTLTRSAVVYDSGVPVGRLEIEQSLLPMTLKTALLALDGLILGILAYITLRVIPVRLLTDAAKRWRLSNQAIDAALNAIIIIDALIPGEPIIYVNPAFVRATGYFMKEIIGRDFACLFGPDPMQTRMAIVQNRLHAGNDAHVTAEIYRNDGTRYWAETFFARVEGEENIITNYIGVLNDITERIQSEDQLKRHTYVDELTGLANRAAFLEHVEVSLAAFRSGVSDFAVMFLDLDHFKDINETLGQSVGDALLKLVGQRLQDCMKGSEAGIRFNDSIGGANIVARLGGDEFAILQNHIGDPSAAGRLAARLLLTTAAPSMIDGHQLHITTSIGISPSTPGLADAGTLLTRAELALYRAKDEGRNQYRFHSADLDRIVRERVSLTDEMRKGLAQDEFELFYQPQVELASGRLIGLEALVRWNHPRLGLLRPDAFIPVAEATGLIVGLGDWIIDAACRQINAWAGEALVCPVLAVNVSGAQFRANGELQAHFSDCLRKWNVDPALLEVELTESVLMATAGLIEDPLRQFRDLGMSVAIDDFGTGYSSLAYLSKFKVNRLKVAMQFVHGALENPSDAAIVRATVNLARALGLRVIAEGPESREQVDFLLSIGCQEGQGFYYSRPVTAMAAGRLLREGKICPEGGAAVSELARLDIGP
jgi:diguanylate cyclase (GGDEF)-like protein/PAS domain S-box-containing protein